MVAIEGNGDATEAEVPATELQWGDGDSQRCEGETEGGMEGKGGRGRGRERRRRISVLYFYLLADAHDRETESSSKRSPRATEQATDADGLGWHRERDHRRPKYPDIFHLESERERERMEEPADACVLNFF